jgi:hypothetical protein
MGDHALRRILNALLRRNEDLMLVKGSYLSIRQRWPDSAALHAGANTLTASSCDWAETLYAWGFISGIKIWPIRLQKSKHDHYIEEAFADNVKVTFITKVLLSIKVHVIHRPMNRKVHNMEKTMTRDLVSSNSTWHQTPICSGGKSILCVLLPASPSLVCLHS